MSDTPPWSGGKLGPYHLRRRYRNTGSEPERIYEAINVETGAPALVVMPGRGEVWSSQGLWTVRTTSGDSPSFLALEVERAPQASPAALHQLTLLSIRLSGALAAVEDREDAAAFLTQQPRPRPSIRERPHAWWLPMGAGALATAALLWAAMVLWPRPPAPTTLETKLDPAVAKTTLEEPVAWIDQQDPAPPVIGYALPSKPFKEQRLPPCLQGTETEINGGCWVQLKHDAPCPWSTAEHEGKCYMPVRKKPPEPSSVQP